MICPNHPLVWDAYSRFGSTGDPLMWYISQPAKCGPLTSHFSRLPSDVRTNAPLRVPTKTRTRLIFHSFSSVVRPLLERTFNFATAKCSFVPVTLSLVSTPPSPPSRPPHLVLRH